MRILFLLTCIELKDDHYHDVQHDNQDSDEKRQDLKDHEVKQGARAALAITGHMCYELEEKYGQSIGTVCKASFQARGLLF